MSLQFTQRSKSAPQVLSAIPSHDPTPLAGPSKRISPLVTPHPEAQDPFNLDGFFPRTRSYYALNSLGNPSEPHSNWMYSESENHGPSTVTHSFDPPVSLPITPEEQPPSTASILSPIEDDGVIQRQIEDEDRVTGIAYAAFTAASQIASPAFHKPSYEHEHIFHSYDALHSTLCEKRRSATVPDFSKFGPKETYRRRSKEVHWVETDDESSRVPSLFSPVEEKLDLFKDTATEDDGEERDVMEGDSWVTYIYRGAMRLWVKKSEPELETSS